MSAKPLACHNISNYVLCNNSLTLYKIKINLYKKNETLYKILSSIMAFILIYPIKVHIWTPYYINSTLVSTVPTRCLVVFLMLWYVKQRILKKKQLVHYSSAGNMQIHKWLGKLFIILCFFSAPKGA